MRIFLSLLALTSTLALTACGVDGAPERPTRTEAAAPGISISGGVEVGIAGRN